VCSTANACAAPLSRVWRGRRMCGAAVACVALLSCVRHCRLVCGTECGTGYRQPWPGKTRCSDAMRVFWLTSVFRPHQGVHLHTSHIRVYLHANRQGFICQQIVRGSSADKPYQGLICTKSKETLKSIPRCRFVELKFPVLPSLPTKAVRSCTIPRGCVAVALIAHVNGILAGPGKRDGSGQGLASTGISVTCIDPFPAPGISPTA